MDDSQRTTDHPVPDLQTPEAYDDSGAPAASGPLVPDLHHDSYTLHEVANLLGMDLDVIRHAVQTGELAATKAGHEIVGIARADLLAWLDRRGPGL